MRYKVYMSAIVEVEAEDEDEAAERATEVVYNYDVDLFIDDVQEIAA